MAFARGIIEQGLCIGAPASGFTMDQQFAQHIGIGRATGFACHDHVVSKALHVLRQSFDLGALAGTLAAFKGDKYRFHGGGNYQPPNAMKSAESNALLQILSVTATLSRA
jgi:hypothetical protein